MNNLKILEKQSKITSQKKSFLLIIFSIIIIAFFMIVCFLFKEKIYSASLFVFFYTLIINFYTILLIRMKVENKKIVTRLKFPIIISLFYIFIIQLILGIKNQFYIMSFLFAFIISIIIGLLFPLNEINYIVVNVVGFRAGFPIFRLNFKKENKIKHKYKIFTRTLFFIIFISFILIIILNF